MDVNNKVSLTSIYCSKFLNTFLKYVLIVKSYCFVQLVTEGVDSNMKPELSQQMQYSITQINILLLLLKKDTWMVNFMVSKKTNSMQL